jgi:hypothetical protein
MRMLRTRARGVVVELVPVVLWRGARASRDQTAPTRNLGSCEGENSSSLSCLVSPQDERRKHLHVRQSVYSNIFAVSRLRDAGAPPLSPEGQRGEQLLSQRIMQL